MSLAETPIHRPYLIYSAPRAGSTLLQSLLGEHSRQLHGTISLGEFLNPLGPYYRDTGQEITRVEPVPNLLDWNIEPDQRKSITSSRIVSLKKYHPRYSLKVIAGQIPKEELPWFRDSFEWIFIERKNLFEQFLSFAISSLTGQWYVPGGISLPQNSLRVNTSLLPRFTELLEEYRERKDDFPSAPVLYYEDVVADPSPLHVVRRIAPATQADLSHIWMPEKQNRGDKLKLFTNGDEVVEQYRASPLQTVFRI